MELIIGLIVGAIIMSTIIARSEHNASMKAPPHPDTDRLNWLIDQGPPEFDGGMHLNDAVWDISYQFEDGEPIGDRDRVRSSIDHGMRG